MEDDEEYVSDTEFIDDIPEEEVDEDSEEEVEEGDNDIIVKDQLNRIPDTERTTYNHLTKYEKTRILTVRMEQLALGSPPIIDVITGMTVSEIAHKELDERKIPLRIRRKVKNNKFEEWKLNELIY